MQQTGIQRLREIRRRNLVELVARHNDRTGRGGVQTVAKRLGHGWAGFVSQMRTGHKTVTEQTARAIEAAFGLPDKAMDSYPLPPEGVKGPAPASENRLLRLLTEAAERADVELDIAKLTAALRLMKASANPDETVADSIISLMR